MGRLQQRERITTIFFSPSDAELMKPLCNCAVSHKTAHSLHVVGLEGLEGLKEEVGGEKREKEVELGG